MAAVAVTADNKRVDAAEIGDFWNDIGDGEEQTGSFADATIPAGSVLAVVTSAVASSPTEFIGMIEFTVD